MTAASLTAIASILLPVLLAGAIWIPGLRRLSMAAAPWAALPALVLAEGVQGPASTSLDGVLIGMRLGAEDAVARAFLLFTSFLWLIAGLYARSYMAKDEHRARFGSLFLLTLAGNLGVVLAADLVSFYFFYALMTFSAYGLVVHEGTQAARHAGRVYLVMALIGEMLLLTAFFLIVGTEINIDLRDVPQRIAGDARRDLLVGLLLSGFGIKAGALFLHMWLPLAHPVAPTPASAVLSGAMIKAGLLGWLRFLPLGAAAMPDAGLVCLIAGFAAAFYGVAIGVTQKDPKTILAYSSISQMGVMTAALGVGLSNPEAAAGAVTAILFYAMHHALAKGALFLGVGVAKTTGAGWPGRLVTLGLLWPALDLAGAPLSSGALAKISLKTVLVQSPWGAAWLPSILTIAAVGSTLLMVSFLVRTTPRDGEGLVPSAGLWAPWALLLVVDLVLLVSPPVATEELRLLARPSKLWDAAWPVGMGVVLAAAGARLARRRGRTPAGTPPGDVLYFVELFVRHLQRVSSSTLWAALRSRLSTMRARLGELRQWPGRLLRMADRAENTLSTFSTLGFLFVFLGLLAAVFLLVAS